MIPWNVNEATVDQCRSIVEMYEYDWSDPELEGHGISTKDQVRYRNAKDKVMVFDVLGIVPEDIRTFMIEGRALFAAL